MKSVVSRLFLAAAVLAILAPAAHAVCTSAQPSISVTAGEFTDNAQLHLTSVFNFPDTNDFTQRWVGFYRDNNLWFSYRPGSTSGTDDRWLDFSCLPPGNHTVTVVAAACGATWSASGSATVNVNPQPTLSASLNGPDQYGNAQITSHFRFPHTLDYTARFMGAYIDGRLFAQMRPLGVEGDWNPGVSFACLPSGPHTIDVVAASCGGTYVETRQFVVNVDSSPDVGVAVRRDQNGANVADVTYNFPNTPGFETRWLGLDLDGKFCCFIRPSQTSGVWTQPIGCAREVVAKAVSCGGGNPDSVATAQTTADLQKTQVEVASMVREGNQVRAVVSYRMPLGTTDWRVQLETLPSYGENLAWFNRVPIGECFPSQSEPNGRCEFLFTPPHGELQVQVLARALSSCDRAEATGSVGDMSCPLNRTLAPVYFSDGNMRYTDSDPLPRQPGGVGLTRTYDTHHNFRGAFGLGWYSMFDQRLTVAPSVPADWIYFKTATNEVVAFRRINGVYEQMWPRGRGLAGTMSLDAATNIYSYREPGADRVALFRAWDGRFAGYRYLDSGREMQVTWNANGYPTAVTDSWTGLQWTVTMSPQLRITSIGVTGRSDLTWTYVYDGSGALTRVSAPDGTPWRTYEYVNGFMTAARDARGNVIETHTYDATTRRATSSDGNGDEIANIQYGLTADTPGDRKTRVTLNTGATTDYTLRPIAGAFRTVRVDGGCTSCGSRDALLAYDAEGRIVRVQDARGYVSVTTYAANRPYTVQKFLRPAGCDPETDTNRCRLNENTLGGALLAPTAATTLTQFTYGDAAWPDRVTQTAVTSVLSSGGTRRSQVVYDPATGNVTSRSDIGFTGSPVREETRVATTAFYDGTNGAAFTPGGAFEAAWLTLPQPAGVARSTDGPRTDVSDVSEIVYYPVHASVPAPWRGRVAALRNAAGHITRYENYDLFGNAQRVIDANGAVTESTFDALGRVATTTTKGAAGCDTAADPLCATDLTTTRTYSPLAGPLETEQRPGGGVTVYTYDAHGHVATITRGPSAADLRERITYDYDAVTHLKTGEHFLAFENGAWVEKKSVRFDYDSDGRVRRTFQPPYLSPLTAGDYEENEYGPGNDLVGVKDARHSSPNTRYAYDAAGRLKSVRQLAAPNTWIETRYGYDTAGNLTSVIDPNGNTTSYVFDDFGQMLRQTSPVTGITTYGYDVAGNLITTADANAATTTRVYDVLGRVTTSTSSRAGVPSETVTRTYDDATAGRHAIGRLATMSDPSGSTSYRYNRLGLLSEERKTVEGTVFVSAFAHDADGNRNRMTYPSGRVVDYTFDFAGRPLSASSGTTVFVASAKYLPFGPEVERVFGNGTKQTMPHDARYLPMENKLAGPSANTIAEYDYTHDAGRNVTAIHDALDATYNRDFGYDDLGRLVTANSGSSLWGSGSYSYDAMGNIMSLSLGTTRTASFSYLGTTPKIATATENGVARSVGYDAAGNETAVGATTYGYTARNQLAAADALTYDYDGRGIRTITRYPAHSLQSLTLSAATVYPNQSATGTVTLSAPAPAGGTVVQLASSVGFVSVPASVSIAAGSTTAIFGIDVANDVQPGGAVITATYGVTKNALLAVAAGPSLTSITLNPSTLPAGAVSRATVTLAAAAPAGGARVLLSSNVTAAVVPASVTISAGATSAEFDVTTSTVAATTGATITARYGNSVTATLTIDPVGVTSLAILPPSVMGGAPATGTVTLTGTAPAGGSAVTLTSSDPARATVPATITVPAGQTAQSFTITTAVVSTTGSVTITAALGTTSRTATLTTTPCVPATAAAPTIPSGDTVWIEDALPAGATTRFGPPWDHPAWDTTQKASGSHSFTRGYNGATGEFGISIGNLNQPIAIGEKLVLYLNVNECKPPREIRLSWGATDSWYKRVYWGEALLGGESEAIFMGPVPAGGQWVRVEIPAASLSMEQRTLAGIDLTNYGGQVWFDHVGKSGTPCIPAVAPAPTIPSGDTVWIEDAMPAGTTTAQGPPWGIPAWDTTQKASGNQAFTRGYNGPAGEWGVRVSNINQPIAIGEKLVLYLMVNECAPPREIRMAWGATDGWFKRAYWGEALLGGESEAIFMGPIPAGGQWVRVEIPASSLGMEAKTLAGIDLTNYGGQVWFDHVGKSGTPCIPAVAPAPTIPSGDTVWIEDAMPAGTTTAQGPPWGIPTWDTTQKASGNQAFTRGYNGPAGEWGVRVTNINQPIAIGEKLVVYFMVNECAPPREIRMAWGATNGWFKRAYWGEALLGGESEAIFMGPIPAGGQWVRAEIPASSLGMELKTLAGIDLTNYGGQVWFDHVGKSGTACIAAAAPAPTIPSGDTIWIEDAMPSGTTTAQGPPWGIPSWDTAQKASGSQSFTRGYNGATGEYGVRVSGLGHSIAVGDKLVAYFMVSECAAPREIRLTWTATDGTYKRAYWGEALIGGEAQSLYMGPIPAGGQWTRVEIPASSLLMEQRTLNSIDFNQYGGQVWFDHVGKVAASSGSLTLPAFFARSRRYAPISLSVTAPLLETPSSATDLRKYSLYTPELSLLAETSVSTTPTIAREYIWFGGKPAAQIDTATNTVRWTFTDHLGTPILQTDASSAVVWRLESDPYGTPTRPRVGDPLSQPLRFPGQEAEGTDRAYNIFRWYRGGWGRYTQSDPLGLPGGLNLYAYVAANPISLIDPLGLATQICCKPLLSPLNEYSHCYVNIEDANGRETWGLHTAQTARNYLWNMPTGNATGTVQRNNDFDIQGDKGVCGPWNDDPCGDADNCARSAAQAYPSPSPYHLTSQNSNTFASYMSARCRIRPPDLVWQSIDRPPFYPPRTPGWFGRSR